MNAHALGKKYRDRSRQVQGEKRGDGGGRTRKRILREPASAPRATRTRTEPTSEADKT